MKKLSYVIAILLLVSLACASFADIAPTEDSMAAESLQNTQTALEATSQAISALQTEQAAPTSTPIPTKYPTKVPTATATPGPLVINDEFDEDVGRWSGCNQCGIADGVFYLGPNPVENDYLGGYIAICEDCGYVEYFKMAVDATYLTGPSDRGFGLVIWENDGNYVDIELTTWKYYGIWYFEKIGERGKNLWYPVTGEGFISTAYLRPGRLTNRVEVEVANQSGRRMAIVSINGKVVKTFEMYGGPGRVGLVVGMHSIGISFDNFYFEGIPVTPSTSPGDNG